MNRTENQLHLLDELLGSFAHDTADPKARQLAHVLSEIVKSAEGYERSLGRADRTTIDANWRELYKVFNPDIRRVHESLLKRMYYSGAYAAIFQVARLMGETSPMKMTDAVLARIWANDTLEEVRKELGDR